MPVDENFHIVISYVDELPVSWLDEFQEDLKHHDLNVMVKSRPNSVFASLEWTLPTLVIAYLTKPYFDGFLKEAGKNHYQILKTGIGKLLKRLYGTNPEERSARYSMMFSIVVPIHAGQSLKFVFPEGVTHEEYNLITLEALNLIENYFITETVTIEKKSTTYLVWIPEKQTWEELDVNAAIIEAHDKQNKPKI